MSSRSGVEIFCNRYPGMYKYFSDSCNVPSSLLSPPEPLTATSALRRGKIKDPALLAVIRGVAGVRLSENGKYPQTQFQPDRMVLVNLLR